MAYEGDLNNENILKPEDFVETINPEWQKEDARVIDYQADDAEEKIRNYWADPKNDNGMVIDASKLAVKEEDNE